MSPIKLLHCVFGSFVVDATVPEAAGGGLNVAVGVTCALADKDKDVIVLITALAKQTR
jgi:hypothetical protein